MHVRILNELPELLDVTWVNKVLYCEIIEHSFRNTACSKAIENGGG